MTATTARRLGASALALLVVVALFALVATPARAAAYRYWTYWQAPAGVTAWAFATQGPGTSVPADGSVEGWAFGVTTRSANPDDAPATDPDFAAVCGSTPAQPDRKRVALVVDPGTTGLSPEGQAPPPALAICVVAEADASGYEILRSVVEVRVEDGLVCGVAGYPVGECAPVVSDAAASAASMMPTVTPSAAADAGTTAMDTSAQGAVLSNDPGSPWTAAVVLGLVAVVGAGLVLVARRRRG